MDWRNYQFWRKNIRRMENEATEFDVYVQATIREFTFRERLRQSIQLLEGSSPSTKKISRWRDFVRDTFYSGKIFSFQKNFDKKLSDPVWETVSMKFKKYLPFLNINVFQFKKVLREIVND